MEWIRLKNGLDVFYNTQKLTNFNHTPTKLTVLSLNKSGKKFVFVLIILYFTCYRYIFIRIETMY